jgi:hypothetical protein
MGKSERNKRTAWIGLGLGCVACVSVPGVAFGQSIILHLRNGDRLTGVLIQNEPQQVTFSNAVVGRLVVSRTEIDRTERVTNGVVAAASLSAGTNTASASPGLAAPFQKKLADLQTAYVVGQISSTEYYRQRAKLLAEASSPARTNGAPMAPGVPAPALVNPAVAAKPPAAAPATAAKPPKPKYWSGEALLGADLGFSQKDRQLYTGRLKLTYARSPLRSAFDYLATYGKTDGELSANRMDGSIKTDYDLSKRTYVYSLGGAGYDEIRKIDWRYEAGPGVGRHLARLTNFVLNAEAGVNYQVQNFEGSRQDDLFHYRLAQDLRWNIGTQFTLDEKVEYLPQWNDFEEYKFRVEGNLRYWVRVNLSFNLTVINTFDTLTAQGVKQNDLQVRSSVGVKF